MSCLVYEARREERLIERMPTAPFATAMDDTMRVWAALADDEADRGLHEAENPSRVSSGRPIVGRVTRDLIGC